MAALLTLCVAGLAVVCHGGFPPMQTCLASALPHSTPNYAHIIQDNCHVGWTTWEVLQIMRPVCYANYTYITPCNNTGYPEDPKPKDGERFWADLEWIGHTKVQRITPHDFDEMLRTHTATWIRGVSYGTSIGFWPHSVQALLPMLNAPLLGWTIDQFVILQSFPKYAPDPAFPGGRDWQWLYEHFNNHRWVSHLLPLLFDCLGITSQMGDESFYYEYTHRENSMDAAIRNAPELGLGPNPGRILCFDTMMVPNNVFTKNCDMTFLDQEYSVPLWRAFRRLIFTRLNIPHAQAPRGHTEIRIGVLLRDETRRVLNSDAMIAAIEEATGLPVKALRFPETLHFDMQVRLTVQFHVLVSVHGAGLMNALFMHTGCAVVEIFLRNWTIPCYYADIFRLHGVNHRAFCAPAGWCGFHEAHRGAEYPRDDNVVDTAAIAKVVKEEVELTRRRLARARLLGRQRPPPFHLPRQQGPGMRGLAHPDRP